MSTGMEILQGIHFKIKNSAVSLGKFDGVHQGHRLLLQEILKENAGIPTVFTFAMDGKVAGNENLLRQQIYGQREKNWILENIGIQREILFPFNEATRQMSPKEFIEKILQDAMDARLVCVGEDFHFGKDRSGDVALLQKYAEKYHYKLKIFPKLRVNGDVVSSTRIRSLLQKGKLERANQLLGEAFFFMGEVIHGNALGRTMQMPTANVRPEPGKILPPAGVYASVVTIGGKRYPAVSNLGYKPTVGADSICLESYLLDFNQDIYGQEIMVSLYHFLRPEQKFAGLEELRRQMLQDKMQAANALRNL